MYFYYIPFFIFIIPGSDIFISEPGIIYSKIFLMYVIRFCIFAISGLQT